MKEHTKKLTFGNIERNTQNVLYYMTQAAESMQKGESAVRWLCAALEYAADLKVDYAKADDLEIYEDLDFKGIYRKALKQAQDEIELGK